MFNIAKLCWTDMDKIKAQLFVYLSHNCYQYGPETQKAGNSQIGHLLDWASTGVVNLLTHDVLASGCGHKELIKILVFFLTELWRIRITAIVLICLTAAIEGVLQLKDSTLLLRNSTLLSRNSTLLSRNNTLLSRNSTLLSRNSTLLSRNSTLLSKNSTLPSKSPRSSRQCVDFLDEELGFECQARHQNEIRKVFLRPFPLSRFLAKTLRVNIELP